MNFKDIVAKDNVAVFINPDEFGEPKVINGAEYQVVIDHDLINERLRLYTSGGNNTAAEGVFLSTVIFFIRESDLGYVPVEGETMRFGNPGERGYPYLVTKVSSAMGILEITIEANQS